MKVPLQEYTNNEGNGFHPFLIWKSTIYSPNEAIPIAKDYCLQASSDIDMRVGLEFLYMNGFDQDLHQLIEKNKQSSNLLNQQWGHMYELHLARKNRSLSGQQLLKGLHHISITSPEMNILKNFLFIYIHYGSYQFDALSRFLDKQYELLPQVEDPLLHRLFQTRLHEVLFIYYWKRNELVLARKHAFQVLNETFSVDRQANIHTNLALSYVLEDYGQCIMHIEESLRLAESFGNTSIIEVNLHQNLPFISAYHRKTDGICSNNRAEQAHLEIAKGNKKKAIDILEKLPYQSPFKTYYVGLAKQDKDLLKRSYHEFIEKRSDYFFSRLPLQALKVLG
ncbi:AimR family lysis-lysogeny pheromone receptor [Radiobacillus kanasensis]|uniref:AimR family lysis-lysogeny pheromone receptor n=1 Tax=Radiobacillus kanasensis TaxID=2844358 RepID=UPI001E40EE33|nr:AimR family lysis-lysogeny pheromone receptor [Radiobacillus kanasensis]UFT98909.1 AimR family lysis-lysogeny pheromone receptor [Radiobacillus kanasensis]